MAKIDKEIFDCIKQHNSELKNNFYVESLSLFGSCVRGTLGPNSDIDILVKYQKIPGLFAFIDLKIYLENLLGRPVDLVTEGALKKQLREKILKEVVRVS